MVDSASMDIKCFTKVLHTHRRTFDVPAREPFAPWAIPFHITLLVFWAKLPESKISRITFLAVIFNACAGLLFFYVELSEIAVAWEFTGVVVHAVTDYVGKTFGFKFLHEINLLGNMIRGFSEIGWCLYVQ